MDRIKPTVKGIHQFSKSSTDRVVFTGKYGCAPPDVSNDDPNNEHTLTLLEAKMYSHLRETGKYKKEDEELPDVDDEKYKDKD